jgi:autotransporter-associated beta strand protein
MKSFSTRCCRSFVIGVAVVCMSPLTSRLCADSFDWGSPYGTAAGISPGGRSWITSVKSQFGGTCWDFSSCGTMEAKYMLTRNDMTYQPNVSEQQLCWETNPDLGGTGGGMEMDALSYMTTHGVVADSVIPHQSAHEDTPAAYPTSPWPLTSVFPSPDSYTNHVWKGVSEQNYISDSTAQLKAALKLYGPLLVTNLAHWDLYSSPANLKDNYRGLVEPGNSATAIDHAVVLVGYYDDATMPTGGYWVIKNSWGTSEGNRGYDVQPYGIIEEKHRSHAETGPVYYTGAMVSATWKSGGTTWTSSGTNWTNDSTQATYTWQNQETAATFNTPGSAVSINNTVVAHSIAVSSAGYTFNGVNNGALTVTSGGITANESVTINVPVSVGAPQTWNVASGKNLTVPAVHTIISPLTLQATGNVTITGSIDGGGVMNTAGGAAPGTLTKNGGGTLYLSGAATYAAPLTMNGGTLNFSQPAGASATFSGVISGSRPVVMSGAGVVTLTGANTYTGETDVNAGTLRVVGSLKNTGTTIVNNGGTLGGTGTMGRVTVNAGGHIAPGIGTSIGALTLGANLTLNSGAKLDLDLSSPVSDRVLLSGGLTLNGQQFSDFNFNPLAGFVQGTYTLIDAASVSGSLGTNTSGAIDGLWSTLSVSTSTGNLILTVVPEPSTLALLFAAVAGASGYAFRRRWRGLQR